MGDSKSMVARGGTEAGRPRVHIQLPRDKSGEIYRRRRLAGATPDESPYGFHLAADRADLSFSQADPDRPKGLISRVLGKICGCDIAHAFANRRAIAQADIVWTMMEDEAFAVALLFRLGVVKPRPLIATAVWLVNDWPQLNPLRRLVYRRLARQISLMSVHSRSCLPRLRQALPHTPSRLIHFGVNREIYRRTDPPPRAADDPIRIFAPGNDRARDWDTLIAAFGGDARFHVTLLCAWLPAHQVSALGNVTIIQNPDMARILRGYDEADFVVVPMVDNLYSGITVALEAVAMGRALLATRTGGVPTYFDEAEVFYVPAGDSEALRQAALAHDAEARRTRAARAHDRFVACDYSTRSLIATYVALTRELLGGAAAAE